MAAHTSGGLLKTSIVVDPEQWARLDRVAKTRRVSKSVILRAAMEAELNRLELGAPIVLEGRVA